MIRLAQAAGTTERKAAIEFALSAGMTYHEIEEHLDWVDASRAAAAPKPAWLPVRVTRAVIRLPYECLIRFARWLKSVRNGGHV